MNDNLDNISADLPLSLQATGTLGPLGDRVEAVTLAESDKGIVTSDGRYFLRSRARNRSTAWVRLPGYYAHLQPEQLKQLPGCSLVTPGCSLKEDRNSEWKVEVDDNTKVISSLQSDISSDSFPEQLPEILRIEELLIQQQNEAASALLEKFFPVTCFHPRILYTRGVLLLRQEEFQNAQQCFHNSALVGHPGGYDAELTVVSKMSQKFLTRYPHIAECFGRNEPLRALTLLRSLQHEYPLFANVFIAYALRYSHYSDEGLAACEIALSEDPLLSDVYGYKWEYYFSLNQIEHAAQLAADHLQLYPFNPRACLDGLDAAIVLGQSEAALLYSHLYLILGTNIHSALKNLFKCLELHRDWKTLLNYFRILTPFARALTPETLRLYGEVLVECEEYTEGLQWLEQSMAAAPEDAESVLAYARAFARSGDLASATGLLESVLHDPSRNDPLPNRFLLISMLSELYRNSDRLADALQIWPNLEDFTVELLAAVGPRPFVEVAYCLAESGNLDKALELSGLLAKDFQSEYIVRELQEKLRGCVD